MDMAYLGNDYSSLKFKNTAIAGNNAPNEHQKLLQCLLW